MRTRTSPNCRVRQVGLSHGGADAAEFTYYPRAAGWSTLRPDDEEARCFMLCVA
jgi:hypothetical protein